MLKYINNKKYNTQTAQLVGVSSNNKDKSDPLYISESLYYKKTGEFFLYCCGGVETKYSKYIKGKAKYNEEIIPYTKDKALEWVKTNLDLNDETIMKFFSENKKIGICIVMEKKYHDKLTHICKSQKITYVDFLKKKIDETLQEDEKL